MKLYIYRGLDGEKVPRDATFVIVDDSVTIIKENAFTYCNRVKSIIMGDNVKRIEHQAFFFCGVRYIRLSKTLEYIGRCAFVYCHNLEALFLPSTVKVIDYAAFQSCKKLRLLMLPNGIDLRKVVGRAILFTPLYQIAEAAGVEYEYKRSNVGNRLFPTFGSVDDTYESIRRVNEWLFHHMDEAPFHKLCYESLVTTRRIKDYLIENGNDSALALDTIHGMVPLHMLTMNPNAPADSIAALLDSNMDAFFCLDNQQITPLEYARKYNVGGLIGMIAGLCNHRNSSVLVQMNDSNNNNVTEA